MKLTNCYLSLSDPCEASPTLSRLKKGCGLENNSTLVWKSAGGVNLILPDVEFGLVFILTIRDFLKWYFHLVLTHV